MLGLHDVWTLAQRWALFELTPIRWDDLHEFLGDSLIDLTLGINQLSDIGA